MDNEDIRTTISMDFLGDYARQACEQLRLAGYRADLGEKPRQIFVKYFNVAKRRISVKPRRFLKSKEFQCPAKHQTGLDEILKKTASGEDLRPHQSRNYFDPGFDDALLNDWGVQHFHLETIPDAKDRRLVKRTGPLLFARVTEEILYCIDVSKTHGAFTQRRMLEILHGNWPDSIARFRISGSLAEAFTDANIGTLRKKNVNAFIAMSDGTVYSPPGGGYSSSGTSVEVVMACNRVVSTCRKMEALVRNEILKIKAEGKRILPNYKFELVARDGRLLAVDAQSGIAMVLGPAEFRPL
jgi:hypothetical protein